MLFLTASSQAEVIFKDEPNDLASGRKVSATVLNYPESSYGRKTVIALYAVCFTASKSLAVAVVPGGVIFPSMGTGEEMSPGRLPTRVRFKFDTDADGTDAVWYTDTEYRIVRSDKEVEYFIERIGSAGKFVAQIGESNIKVSFSLKGTREKVRRVLSACV